MSDLINKGTQVECNERTRHYFNVLNHVLPKVENLFRSSSKLPDGLGVDHYINLFYRSVNALSLKYYFNGDERDESVERLTIQTDGSGFPTRKEFIFLDSIKKNIENEQANYPSAEQLKEKILSHVMTKKEVPYALQKNLSYRLYLDWVESNDVFLPYNEPSWGLIESNEKTGRPTILMTWANFDHDRGIPTIYIMKAEVSRRDFEVEDFVDQRTDRLKQVIKDNTISAYKLLQIAKTIDGEFDDLHPVELKRVSLGPIYCSGITEHNDIIENVLKKVADTDDNWLFQWKVETLLSKGSENKSRGILSSKQEVQIYDIPRHDAVCVDNGISNYAVSMIIPYRAYQALADSDQKALLSERKFVVGDDGELIRL